MSYQIELSDISSVEKNFSLKIEAQSFNSKFQSELSKISSKAHLKGFRPGRAPKAMVAKMYGRQIHTEVVSEFVNEALRKTAQENKLSIVGTSEFKMEDSEEGQDVSLSMTLSLFPEPEIKNIDGLEVEVKVQTYKPEDLTTRLDSIREMYAEFVDVEDRNVVTDNDFITISYTGSYTGEADDISSDELKGDKVDIELGKKQLPDDVEKALIGIAVGETRDVLHTFSNPEIPEENKSEVEEKEENKPEAKQALFKITLDKIRKKVVPELSDEIAKKTGVAETIEELRDFVEKDIKRSILKQNQDSRDNTIVESIVNANDFEVPQVLVDREIRYMLAEMRLLDPSKDDFNESPVEQYRAILNEQASKRLKSGIVLEKLLEDYKIESNESDVDGMLNEFTQDLGVERTELDREYGFPKNMENLKRLCSVRSLMKILAEKLKITEKEIEKEDVNV